MRFSAVFVFLSLFFFAATPQIAAQTSEASQAFSLGERLGLDDGYSLVIDTSSDIQGDMSPCGCNPPLGGLPRRVALRKLLAEQSHGEAAFISVDAGFSFDPAAMPDQHGNDPRIRNAWVLKAYLASDIQAANVSYRDLAYMETMMAAPKYAANVKAYPMLARYISANITPVDSSIAPFQPYRIVEVSSKRLGPKPKKVAFIGISQPVPQAYLDALKAHHIDFPVSTKFKIGDPVEALKKYVPELRKKADLVIVLGYMPVAQGVAAGKAVPGVDAFIVGDLITLQHPVVEAGDAIVANAYQQSKYLSELRLFTDPKTGALTNYSHKHVRLDGVIPDDKPTAAMVATAQAEFLKASTGPAAAPVHNH